MRQVQRYRVFLLISWTAQQVLISEDGGMAGRATLQLEGTFPLQCTTGRQWWQGQPFILYMYICICVYVYMCIVYVCICVCCTVLYGIQYSCVVNHVCGYSHVQPSIFFSYLFSIIARKAVLTVKSRMNATPQRLQKFLFFEISFSHFFSLYQIVYNEFPQKIHYV